MCDKEKKEEEMTLDEMLKSVPNNNFEHTKDDGFAMEEIEELWQSESKGGDDDSVWMDKQPKRNNFWEDGTLRDLLKENEDDDYKEYKDGGNMSKKKKTELQDKLNVELDLRIERLEALQEELVEWKQLNNSPDMLENLRAGFLDSSVDFFGRVEDLDEFFPESISMKRHPRIKDVLTESDSEPKAIIKYAPGQKRYNLSLNEELMNWFIADCKKNLQRHSNVIEMLIREYMQSRIAKK